MNKVRRVNIRFSEEVFEALDSKRFEDKTTFQALGEDLFLSWLSGGKQVKFELNRPKRGPSGDRWHDMLDTILRHGDPAVADNLKGVLKVFHEQALLQAESPSEGETKKVRQWANRKADQKSL